MEVVVDTGFTGWLTLSGDVNGQIGLVSLGQRPAILASGEEMLFDIHAALVDWHPGGLARSGPSGDRP